MANDSINVGVAQSMKALINHRNWVRKYLLSSDVQAGCVFSVPTPDQIYDLTLDVDSNIIDDNIDISCVVPSEIDADGRRIVTINCLAGTNAGCNKTIGVTYADQTAETGSVFLHLTNAGTRVVNGKGKEIEVAIAYGGMKFIVVRDGDIVDVEA